MVTEKYLLREEEEWIARHRAMEILDELLVAFRNCDVNTIAKLVTENFFGPIRTVVPWATNSYTETLIEKVQAQFGDGFWGFWMLGGMSGGGMGFIFDPDIKDKASLVLGDIMLETKRQMETYIPFAMDPVVFDYTVNDVGTVAELCSCDNHNNSTKRPTQSTFSESKVQGLSDLLQEQGFDTALQEEIRSDLKNGIIGLANNRLPPDSDISDVTPDDVVIVDDNSISQDIRSRGLEALTSGTVGIVTLAAGVGSRWTQGAGVVKALHPYCSIGGKHRNFIDFHLAKNHKVSRDVGVSIPHVFTTSWMTHLLSLTLNGTQTPMWNWRLSLSPQTCPELCPALRRRGWPSFSHSR
jgi:hypothetical protein